MSHVDLFEDIDEDVVIGAGCSINKKDNDSYFDAMMLCRHFQKFGRIL